MAFFYFWYPSITAWPIAALHIVWMRSKGHICSHHQQGISIDKKKEVIKGYDDSVRIVNRGLMSCETVTVGAGDSHLEEK